VTPQRLASRAAPARSKKRPAAPAAPQQAQGNGDAPQLIFSPWVKALQQGRSIPSQEGLRYRQGRPRRIRPSGCSVAIIEMKASEEASAHEPALWRQPAVRHPLDRGQNQPTTAPFVTCLRPSCRPAAA